MAEAIRPKYLLMKVNNKNRRTLESLDKESKSYYKINSSVQSNHTQIFEIKKIEQHQSEIRNLVWRINSQAKKNQILKSLISLIKQEMEHFQQETQKFQQFEFYEQSKISKKINDHIDQILQKQNEQVANLVRLKQEISSKRSERVVFSNLFRKIEVELKNALHFYQEEIIKSQTFKQEYQPSFSKAKFLLGKLSNNLTSKKNEEDSLSGDRFCQASCRNSHFHFPQQTIYAKKKKLKNERGESKFITQHYQYETNEEKTMEVKMVRIRNQIHQYEFQFQKVLQKTSCNDFQEIEAFASNILKENQILEEELQSLSKKVQSFEKEQRIILYQKKTSEIVEQNCLPKSRLRLRNLKSGKAISTESEIQPPVTTDDQIIEVIASLLGLDSDYQKLIDKVPKIDQKLDRLVRNSQRDSFYRDYGHPKSLQRYSSLNERCQSASNSVLNSILEKMDIINESDKLYGKNELFQAYQREISKCTKKQFRKK